MSVEHSDRGQNPDIAPASASAGSNPVPETTVPGDVSVVPPLSEGPAPTALIETKSGSEGVISLLPQQGSQDVPTISTNSSPEESRMRRWAKTVGEKVGWYGVTYTAGFAAIPITEYVIDGHNDTLVNTASGALYGVMALTLAAVGERIVRKQTTVGHSPSVGAMIGYEHATTKTTDKTKITKETAMGYVTEQFIEELPILAPAMEIAATQGIKPALIFLGGGAIPTIAARVAQYNTLHNYSGEPIFFKKTRERLNTKEKLHNVRTKATEIFHRDHHISSH